MIHIISTHATQEQIAEMLQVLQTYIKLAVDNRRGVLAGGGEMHADYEEILLDDGSMQEDIWGADCYPLSQEVKYESLINIRPRQNNRAMEIQDQAIRNHVAQITRNLLGER